MKNRNIEKLNQVIDMIRDAIETDGEFDGVPRVGDIGTPLSIRNVINDEENRTVVIVWEDGKSTKSVANPDDEYDFTVGFGLCIAKRFVDNLEKYSAVMQNSKRYIHIPKKNKMK